MAIIVPKIIKRGDPVGILYKTNFSQGPCNSSSDCKYSNNQGSCYCVHNGVFYRALYSKNGVKSYHQNINPAFGILEQVTLRHWTWKQGASSPCLENLVVLRIAEVRKTEPVPSSANLKCKKHPKAAGSSIKKGTPIGVSFNEGGLDIKNGVFLYWTNSSNKRYCRLYKSDKPVTVVYLHWIVVKSGNGVAMKLDQKERKKVIRVYRVSTKVNPKSLCK